MRRWGFVLSLAAAGAIACSPPAPASDAQPGASAPEAEAPAPPIKGDDPHPPPTPAQGIACDRPGRRTCDPAAAPLRCVAGSGGAVWMAAEACPPAQRCVVDHGCLPLPACTDVGLLGCVHQALFVCEAQGAGDDAPLAWTHATDCPAAIPCVNGRGCPNPLGVGAPCSFVDPPRCAPDGRVMRCTLEGIEAVWGAPEACGAGMTCVPGQGCRAPEAQDPDAPTSPPDPKGGRSWR